MEEKTEFCCDMMKINIDDNVIIYSPKVREYSIMVKSDPDGFDVVQNIYYCPFCGSKLSISLRDEWFEKLRELGYENPLDIDDKDIPEEFRSDAWWKK